MLGNANSDFVSLPSHQPAFKSLSKAVFEATPVLIEGPMGCGKSRLVERQAELSGRTEFKDFHRIQVFSSLTIILFECIFSVFSTNLYASLWFVLCYQVASNPLN